ncbi:tRNA (adenosine(37)-N6)-threonylcarbamoyltransferase complex ATPase subunit type 1 TsaE [Sporosarcina sp. NCCP-2222]|uniref:tRNA (adenosine(37)-N6)-threonylcarbamoyltransferase complex ATPase subunit type 1 TsaE n=1 Tax=Sporosarcina sp. NCCP-2222 TaxID=2935073 RepID=UPI00208D6E68|nr:tRNA (adenosine(37)-N6)-threonylcarbamoyltransferase complex ATPase subunit type 1 TsaE [Sporosarcina sp. NCCP-2222]GKV56677.1 tRNA (adenosine(37)-N6)-threonylcarbamoyltransferase complex ATPase subunit type 1 TsaE [Sporosarcina sp. NCCP-2222]
MLKEIVVHGPQETVRLAAALASHLSPPDVVTLEGDLGAGKTTFTQALAKALGVTRTVNSPTFTIIKQYEGRYPFNHLDVYRLADSDEDLGWDELFYGDAISVVEWAHLIENDLPKERLAITIRHLGGDSRQFVIQPFGTHFEEICEAIAI